MIARKLSLISLTLLGCGDDPKIMPDAEDFTLGEAPQLAMPCNDQASDIYAPLPTLPAMDDSHRGDVFRCAVTEKLTVPEVKSQIEAYNENKFNTTFANLAPGNVKSGFWSYRIAYRSTRNTVNGTRAEGDMGAILLIPAKPLEGAPLVVFGHGSVGFAQKCAPSNLDLSAPVSDQDYPPMLYRLAGYGYTVIAPDYAGYGWGQTPGYFNAEDEAHAVLDATRAAAKILPTPHTKVAFVGHSQGAHAMISAHSYAKAYGMSGELVGVATLAPYWFSLGAFAAVVTAAGGLETADPADTTSILYAMTYAYAAGELRDPGHGLDIFVAAKRDGAKEVINGAECYDRPKMVALGATPSDFFEPSYVMDVGYNCAGFPFPSCGDPGDPADVWKQRWAEDRPQIDPNGAPILAVFGKKDTFIKPGRGACAREKFTRDLASGGTTKIEYCFNDEAQHRDIIRGPDVDYLNEWIAAKAGIGAAPGACPEFPAALPCETPPNDF